MAVGMVIKMHWWKFNTPNKGILRDLDTNVEYSFSRPPITSTSTKSVPKWNVGLYDVVSFTVSGTEAINVTLLKKHRQGRTIVRINT